MVFIKQLVIHISFNKMADFLYFMQNVTFQKSEEPPRINFESINHRTLHLTDQMQNIQEQYLQHNKVWEK
jgi:hypothetical protein